MSFAHLLTDRITVASPTGVDSYGSPTYGAQVVLPARVEFGTKTLYGRDGTQRQCLAVLVTATAIPHDARVWLPGDNTADTNVAKRPIETRNASSPWGGPAIYETYL